MPEGLFRGPEKLRIIPAAQSQIVVALGQLPRLLTPKLQLFKGTVRSAGRREVFLAPPVDGTDGESQQARWAVGGPGLGHRQWASQVALVVKNPPVMAGDVRDLGLIPGSGRSPGGGNGNPLQYSCLENSMDRKAWWATVHGVTKSWTQLSD